ncbi:MAG: class I SAM-dependent methyltransferase [Micromonosporaceae bacterium]|nr:class I SAM-dependent methyltransferase [Micromonosporaceae bacterium]
MTDVSGDTRLQSTVLESLSSAVKYRRWLADLARPYLGEHPIEIGSGNGDYAAEWVGPPDRRSTIVSFTATEADAGRAAELARRFADHPAVRTRSLLLGHDQPTVAGAEPEHTAAVAYNVLEHIADDVAAVRGMAELVRPGGAVVVLVPAFPSAMSRFDVAIGHYRRYTRQTLRETLTRAELDIELLRYVNPIGLISWYVTVKGLGVWPDDGWLVRVYDRMVVPVARAVDHEKVPFGQSVFAVARVR